MSTATIPLAAVRDALMLSKVRQCTMDARASEGKKPLSRYAAYSRYPDRLLVPDCARPNWNPWRLRLAQTPIHLSLMTRGKLPQVLRTVRQRGLAEVRRTWGEGMRTLQKEFADGVLR